MSLTTSEQKLHDRFVAQGRTWTPAWERVLKINPTYFATFCSVQETSFRGSDLPLKYLHLFLLAADASCCTNYVPEIQAHIAAAYAAGATPAEVMETLELTSIVGIHSVNSGLPILREVLAERGMPPIRDEGHKWNPRQQQLKDNFTSNRGYWSPLWDDVLALDPDFFEAYSAFSGKPWTKENGVLPPKIKEMVYIAFDAACTHMYLPGTKIHINNAINHGATPEEIMVVLKLANLMGMHTLLEGAAAIEALK